MRAARDEYSNYAQRDFYWAGIAINREVATITMDTVYTIRSDWDTEGERYTVLKNNRVVIITRSRRIVREWFPHMWMDTRSIPDTVLL
jgi:hypothetical protein